MKKGSFNERVQKCMTQFREVQIRSDEKAEHYGVRTFRRPPAEPKEPLGNAATPGKVPGEGPNR